MKKILILTGLVAMSSAIISCGGGQGNNPGQAYMPDMYYSRAYEAYGYNNLPVDHDLKSRSVYYTGTPVKGTIARGDAFSIPMAEGDSGYARAATFRRTDTVTMTAAQMKEAERLYLINCGICHGAQLDGNGPLWKGGDGPYPAAPRNLKDDYSKALSDGQMFHAITYGKGQMGAYASQVSVEQRWWLIDYIRSKQGGARATTDTAAAGATTPAGATAGTDTTKTN
ncbi:MAG TPA: cytochrome c [Chitinophagaceae bacterium]